MDQKRVDNSVKFVVEVQHIAGKIQRLYREWKDLENAYKRKDRNARDKEWFKKKESDFVILLDTPTNILKKDYEYILRVKSGVNAWEEDLAYFHNQLQRTQKG